MSDEIYVPDADEPEGYDAWFWRDVEIGLRDADAFFEGSPG